MKVALLLASTDRTGVETHTLVLARALRELGVTPVVVAPRPGPLTASCAELGVEVRLASPRGRLGVFEFGRLAGALRDVDLLHAQGVRPIYWSALLRTFGGRLPTLGTIHEFRLTGHESWRGAAYRVVEDWSFGRYRHLIAVSHDLARRVVAAGVVRPERISMIPNSSSLLFDDDGPRTGFESPARALIAARLEPVKGIDVLLEAWRLLGADAPELDILGEGSQRAELEQAIARLDLGGRVHLRGQVADVRGALRAATLYVGPSRMEGLPAAVLEAMASGLPTIATAVGGHHDLMDEAAPEWLVPVGDARALADRVRALLALPLAERLALGERLRAVAHRSFHPLRMAEATLDLYRRMLAEAP